MTVLAPKPQLILGYRHFFQNELSDNERISLIQNICKTNLIFELAGLNYRLKPKNQVQFDNSSKSQIRELKYFTRTEKLFIKYASKAHNHARPISEFPTLFSRQSCAFALEEITNNETLQEIEGHKMSDPNVWESILKYILAVNDKITKIEIIKGEPDNFETLNPKLIPLNELGIETDQILTPYRGYHLISFILRDITLAPNLIEYIKFKYQCEPFEFIYHIFRLFLANSSDKPELQFFYQITEEFEFLFNALSQRIANENTFSLLGIKKSPLIKIEKNQFVLADSTFLIEKSYSQLINDFWFDHLKNVTNEKGKKIFNISIYKSTIGYFFEEYVANIFKHSFQEYKHSKLLLFDNLKINQKTGNIEIADVFLRYGKRVLLGQVKSGSLNDKSKYGGNLEELYQQNRDKFFKNFGINQLVTSIHLLEKYIKELDPKFPVGKTYKIYPCIIVNDKIFQTPLMPDIMNDRFKELLSEIDLNKVHVYNLNVIHISDLEKIQNTLHTEPKLIWELLQYNLRDKKFSPPFYNTTNEKINHSPYLGKVLELYTELNKKFENKKAAGNNG